MGEFRALDLRASEIRFSQLSAHQNRAFEVPRAKGNGFGNRLDLCFAIEFRMIDRVEARQHEAVRPKAFRLAGGKMYIASNQQFMQGGPAP